MPWLCRWLLALGAVLASGALARAQCPEPPPGPGLVIVVGGVAGWDFLPTSAQLVCPLAGVPHQIHDFVWGHGWGRFFSDLMDSPHLARKADELARLILDYKAAAPDRPVYVVAKSGGSALALLAAEQLPPSTLERLILISAAVRPDYDLRPALRATRRELVSYYSNLDRLILGWGTRTFGTADRVHCRGAGCVGFLPPQDLDAEGQGLYRRVVQIHWRPRMILQGYAGGHSGNSFPLFMLVHVVPWLREPRGRPRWEVGRLSRAVLFNPDGSGEPSYRTTTNDC
jgi:pimeloyl-ACP methyl ester carboxylesterase